LFFFFDRQLKNIKCIQLYLNFLLVFIANLVALLFYSNQSLWRKPAHNLFPIAEGSSFIPKPAINDTYLNPVVVGGRLYLECIARATLGIKFTIQWHLPESVKVGQFFINSYYTLSLTPCKKYGSSFLD
jgi:hypothetical protein